MAGGLRIDRGVALVAQTQLCERKAARQNYFSIRGRTKMPSILNEALEWLDLPNKRGRWLGS
jgi:hypothetical protein